MSSGDASVARSARSGGDITALADPKFGVVERVRYGPTGRPEAFPAADIDFNGEVSSDDEDNFQTALNKYDGDPANYDPRADLVRDGVIDANDEAAFYRSYDKFNGLSGNWKLSQGDGLLTGKEPSGLDNRFGWRGYWYDPHLQKYHVRNRVYDPREGRWMQNDPLGFAAGDQDLYRYCNGEYSTGYDPLGLEWNDAQTWGVLKYVGGALETFAGTAIIATTGWTGVGAVIGGVMIAHGVDTMIAGGRQVFDGDEHETFTAWAPHSIAVNVFGASDETGRVIGGVVDLGVGMLGVFYSPAAGARVFTFEVGGMPARALQTAGGISVVVADGRAIALTTEQAIRLALIMNAAQKVAAIARANPLGQLPQGQAPDGCTGDSGWVNIAEDDLGTGTPTTEAARRQAREMGRPDDDAGHLIGRNLGGKGGAESGNTFPQSPSWNRGAYRELEKNVANQVRAGKTVSIRAIPQYAPGSTRPFAIEYHVNINGTVTTTTIPNP